MLDQLTRNWWLLALRGVIAVLFAIVAFALPMTTIAALMMLFGVFVLLDGVFTLIAAVRFRHQDERWGALLFEGLLGVALGVMALFFPTLAAVSLVFLVAIWALATGVLQVFTAIKFRKEIEGERLLALGGILSILLGILLFLVPEAGVVAWAWMLGGYALIAGAMLLWLAFRLHSMCKTTHLRPQST